MGIRKRIPTKDVSTWTLNGNKVLVQWAQDKGIRWDRCNAFHCLYEQYFSDRLTDADKKVWRTDVAIK